MKKTILYTLFLVFANSILQAQIPLDDKNMGFVKSLKEEVIVFTDRDLYLSGEQLWFTAYVVVNNTFQEFDLSKIVYLELIDAVKKKTFKGKFEINEGIAAGSFQVPAETLSGNYFIRTYTQYQRNFPPEVFATKNITIINPEFSLPGQKQIPDTLKGDMIDAELKKGGFENEIEIILQTDKYVYNKRESMELKLEMPGIHKDKMASLCVSVIRRGTFRKPKGFISSVPNMETESGKDQKGLFWIPETRGVGISGYVSEKKSLKPVAGANIYLSVLGDNPQLHIVQTKENGEFVFSLGYITGEHEIFIGTKPDSANDIRLFVNNDFSNDYPQYDNVPFTIDIADKNLIEEMLVNFQSQKIFTPLKEMVSDVPQAEIEIFGKPDFSLLLADYIDLPNLQSIFLELIPSVIVKSKNGQKSLHVVNPETDWVFESQLLLLDHVPVFDFDAVLGIPPLKIEKIGIINKTYYLGDNTLRNVVMIDSKSKDFTGYDFPNGSIFFDYQTITPRKTFDSPTYENQSEKISRIPDFRTLLYWNPKLSISRSDTTISFFTSDNTGEYDIIVRGITKEGESCFGKGTIRIE